MTAVKKYLKKKYLFDDFSIVSKTIIKDELLIDDRELDSITQMHNGLFEFREVCQIIEANL